MGGQNGTGGAVRLTFGCDNINEKQNEKAKAGGLKGKGGETYLTCFLLLKGFISVMTLMPPMAPMALMELMAGNFFVQFCVLSVGKVVFRAAQPYPPPQNTFPKQT